MSNPKISIQELVESIAQQTGNSKKKAEEFIKVLQSTIEEGLINDRIVKIKGFGTFKLLWNEPRKSVNVQTGEEYLIPGHTKVTFIPDATIKEIINNPSVPRTKKVIKKEIDPLEKLNKEAEEIKEIIADIKQMKKSKKTEAIVELLPEAPVEVKPEVKDPHESVQHAALSEKHVLHDRDIPIKPKKKIARLITLIVLILVIVGGVGFYLEYKDTLIPTYKNKLVAKITALKHGMKTSKKDKTIEAKVIEKKNDVAPVDTITTIESSANVEPAPKSTPKEQVTQVVENKKSVFDAPKDYKTIQATEKIEKGGRLVLLAEKYYGHKDFWVYIYEANRDILKSPGSLFVGMSIKVPKLNPALIDLNNPECLKQAKTLENKYLGK